MFDTPVVLFIFNRPALTARVWEVIRKVQPARLFVVADGPRTWRASDIDTCAAARAVIETVDWKCELVKDFAEVNLGSGRRVSSGIRRVFDRVDTAIFVEDDVLPDATFFPSCEELLKVYRDEERVALISGFNPFVEWKEGSSSYLFARLSAMWGWASWERAWRDYDFEFKTWQEPDIYERVLAQLGDAAYTEFLMGVLERLARGEVDAWDLQFQLQQILRGALSVVPQVNLISNLGFGRDATNTRLRFPLSAELERRAMEFPLRAPPGIAADDEYDKKYMEWSVGHPDLEMVITRTDRELAAQRHAVALLWVQGALRAGLARTGLERARLNILQARALYALGQPERALGALREALDAEPACEAAQRLYREWWG